MTGPRPNYTTWLFLFGEVDAEKWFPSDQLYDEVCDGEQGARFLLEHGAFNYSAPGEVMGHSPSNDGWSKERLELEASWPRKPRRDVVRVPPPPPLPEPKLTGWFQRGPYPFSKEEKAQFLRSAGRYDLVFELLGHY